jgi:hypothetical protein
VAFFSSYFVTPGSADFTDTNVLGEIDSDVFVGPLT